jgi:hypothetical protein
MPDPSKARALLPLLLQPGSLILLGANLVPLVGVIFWGWDAFVLLMLYWLETAIIAFWTVTRIATLPVSALEDIKIGSGKSVTSSVGLAVFFTLHAGIFMGVHFLFLWELFSDDWARKIHGFRDFIDQMVIGTGLWVPLLALFIVRGALMLFDSIKPQLMRRFGIVPRRPREPAVLGPGETLLFGLYLRIVVMQVTIIIGAWFALILGNAGALIFLIIVKTAVDLSFQIIAEHVHAAMLKARAEQAATDSQA